VCSVQAWINLAIPAKLATGFTQRPLLTLRVLISRRLAGRSIPVGPARADRVDLPHHHEHQRADDRYSRPSEPRAHGATANAHDRALRELVNAQTLLDAA
jgi:hypothetical protein